MSKNCDGVVYHHIFLPRLGAPIIIILYERERNVYIYLIRMQDRQTTKSPSEKISKSSRQYVGCFLHSPIKKNQSAPTIAANLTRFSLPLFKHVSSLVVRQ